MCMLHFKNQNIMNQLISNSDKAKYMQILTDLNQCHAKLFTQKELSEHLNVSVRKISDFQNGNLIDFWLLVQYAGIIGKTIKFDLR